MTWASVQDEPEEAAGLAFGILSDLSANLFAALLLILILLLQLKMRVEQAPAPPATIEATEDLGAQPRRPMPGHDLVALLRARAPGAGGLGLDLVEDGAVLTPGDREVPGARIGALLGEAAREPSGAPVRLYVFDNRWYGAVTEALRRAGHAWVEISVPRALRDPSRPQAFSPAFLRLLATPTNEAGFRGALARLLTGGRGPLIPSGHAIGFAQQGGGTPPPQAPNVLRVALPALAILAGLGIVFAIECLHPSPIGRRR